MIDTREKLKEYLQAERALYQPTHWKKYLIWRFVKSESFEIWKYVVLLRKCEYWANQKGKLASAAYYFLCRKKNQQGYRVQIEASENCFKKGLKIYHGNVIVNSHARIGENCVIHGHNCVGNNGLTEGAPLLGDNVELGVGAVIIGPIQLANGIKLGAHAVACKSELHENSTLIGVPARILRDRIE